MVEQITTGLTTCIGAVGDVVSALTATDGELAGLLVFIGLSVGASLVMFGIKAIKAFAWGF